MRALLERLGWRDKKPRSLLGPALHGYQSAVKAAMEAELREVEASLIHGQHDPGPLWRCYGCLHWCAARRCCACLEGRRP